MANDSPDSIGAATAIRSRMPDGVILIARRSLPARRPRAFALLLPDLGEDVAVFDSVAVRLAQAGVVTVVIELRGHGHSEGSWTLAGHLRDYRSWLWTMRKEAKRVPLLIVARGLSATLALLHEEIAHRHHETKRPALPDGMLLIDPIARGADRVPRGLRTIITSRSGACRSIPRRERKILHAFSLPPVRVQTPASILMSSALRVDDPEDPTRKVFGAVHVRRVPWLRPSTRIARDRRDVEIAAECARILSQDRPHRFRAITR